MNEGREQTIVIAGVAVIAVLLACCVIAVMGLFFFGFGFAPVVPSP